MDHPNPNHRCRGGNSGITVLEILIALGVLVVLLSFAAPSLSGATARAELKAAVENMDLNIRMARNAARQFHTTVVMHLETDRRARHHRVTYSMPDLPANAQQAATLLDYEFPESVRMTASEPSVRFDFRGMIDQPVQVTLLSMHDDDLSERILVH